MIVQNLDVFFGRTGDNKARVGENNPHAEDLDSFFGSAGTDDDSINERQKTLPYLVILAPYDSTQHSSNFQEYWDDSSNIGYKFHLNVQPHNVVAVSNFLKKHGIVHKYLSGGDVSTGKIFTVYAGSKDQTQRILQIVSEIEPLIEKSLDLGIYDGYYTPKISGRFCGDPNIFTSRFGIGGLTHLPEDEFKDPSIAYERAKAKLQEIYGDYFGGGLFLSHPPNHPPQQNLRQ